VRISFISVVLVASCLSSGAGEPQQPTESPHVCQSAGNPDGPVVESINVHGLNRMSEPAFLHALGLGFRARYDLEHLQSRLDVLWDLGFFEEIDFDAITLASGDKVLTFTVRELALVQSITFDDTNVLDPELALDRFDDLALSARSGRPSNLRKLPIAEQAVRDLLADCGYLDSTVNAEVIDVTDAVVTVHFSIDVGEPVKGR